MYLLKSEEMYEALKNEHTHIHRYNYDNLDHKISLYKKLFFTFPFTLIWS